MLRLLPTERRWLDALSTAMATSMLAQVHLDRSWDGLRPSLWLFYLLIAALTTLTSVLAALLSAMIGGCGELLGDIRLHLEHICGLLHKRGCRYKHVVSCWGLARKELSWR